MLRKLSGWLVIVVDNISICAVCFFSAKLPLKPTKNTPDPQPNILKVFLHRLSKRLLLAVLTSVARLGGKNLFPNSVIGLTSCSCRHSAGTPPLEYFGLVSDLAQGRTSSTFEAWMQLFVWNPVYLNSLLKPIMHSVLALMVGVGLSITL